MRSILIAALSGFGLARLAQSVPAAKVGAPERVGYVADIVGVWSPVGRGQVVQVGSAVFAGDTLVATTLGTAVPFVAVVLRSGKVASVHCKATDTLPCTLGLPPEASSSFFGRALDALFEHLNEEPRRYESLMSRGASGAPSDALLRLANGQLDLSPAFASLDSGLYDLCFTSVTPHGEQPTSRPAACVTRVMFDWTPGSPRQVPVRQIHPGLFALWVDGESTAPAWVLISEASQFGARQKSWVVFRDTAQVWSRTLAQPVVRRLERAYLATLSERAP